MLAVLTVTTDQDVVDFADGKLSLREAIFVANTASGADEINFDPALTAGGPATILLTQGQLAISDSLTISGPGRLLLTIDASGNDPTPEENNGDGSRVFLVDDGDIAHRFAAELRGLAVTGGDTSDLRGGGIHSREDLTIVECSVYSNAVRAPEGVNGGWGGGIQSLYGDLTLVDSVVGLNTATISGGGIDFNPVNSDGELRLENSPIVFNHADIRGGGLLVAGNATIVDTSIEDNAAGQEGGGVAVYSLADDPVLHFSNSTILRNSAGLGGGIYSDSATAQIELESTGVAINTAESGGGIWMRRTGEGPLAPDEFPLVLRNSIVSSNFGGGLNLAGQDTSGQGMAAHIEASRISDNKRSENNFVAGDGLTALLERLTISGSWIENNEGVGVQARGQFLVNPALNISDTQVNQNTVGVSVRDMTTTLANTTISGNLGRGIHKLSGTLAMTGGSVSGNMGEGLYGAFGDVSIADAVLSSNKGRGAAVSHGNLTVTGSRFEHNQTNLSGAGIYLANGSLSVMNSIVNHNTAGFSGGGIHQNGATGQTVTITGSEVSENVAGGFGGGIGSSVNLTLVDSKVIGNRANAGGGGINAQRELTMLRSAVSENRTLSGSAPGGGFSASGNVTIVDSSVSKNRTLGTASPGGGASVTGTMNVVRSNISGNSTEGENSRGGGISGMTVSILDSMVSGNLTMGTNSSGGGVNGSNVTIVQSTISSNNTLGISAHGGGVWAGARMSVKDSTVTKNEAQHILAMGGGLMVADGPLTLSNSIVAQNFASGGADSDLKVQTTLTATYTILGSLNSLTPPQSAAFLGGPGNAPIPNPKLSQLAYFGGPEYRDGTRLLTHLPMALSPAINFGDPTAPALPVAWYKFGESSGVTTVVDAMGGLDGVYANGPTLGVGGAPSTNNSAVDFDGVDDYATVPASVGGDFTFSLWVKTSQPSAGAARIGLVDGNGHLSDGLGLYTQNGRVLLQVAGVAIVSSATINDGLWHHVAATRNATTGARSMYVDGVLSGSFTGGPTGAKENADSWRIGGLLTGGGFFDGAMDELAVYDRVLSAAEVLQHVSSGPPAFDQRGEPFSRIVGGRIDIGAVESRVTTLVVDTLVDENDGDFSLGDLSLREAIELANANAGADVVMFDPALTANGPAKILLTTLGDESLNGRAALLITDGVSILGPGADLLTLDASGIDPTPNEDNGDGGRVLTIYDATDSSSMETLIRGLTITGGDVGFNGSLNANGGGINSHFMRLLIQESTVTGNHAEGLGGGVYVNSYHQPGPSLIERSTITSNQADGNGGGIAVRAGEVFGTIVKDSLIANNRGGYRGGGIHVTLSQLNDVPFILENSTVSGNVAIGGGGIGFGNDTNHAIIRYSTIVQNSSIGPDGGGGVLGSRGEATLSHVIIAGNQDAAGLASDLVRGPTEFGIPSTFALRHSLVGANNGSGYAEAPIGAPDANGNLIGGIVNGIIVPGLGPLANNGGPTKTHALLLGSPAIDAGDPAAVAGVNGVPEFDQRGEPFNRTIGGRIDIGAVESRGATLVVDTLVDESDGDFSAGDLSLREAIELTNANAGANVVTFDPALTANGPAKILLTMGQLRISDALDLQGPGADRLTIDASGNDLTPNSTLTDGNDTNDGDGSRVFSIVDDNFSESFDAEISGLTITGGDSSNGAGGLGNSESTRLMGVIIRENYGGTGGGISNSSGTLTVVDSVIAENGATGVGGGIFNFDGNLDIERTRIVHNRTTTDIAAGGGIYSESQHAGIISIVDSEISENSTLGAIAFGGGIYVNGGGPAETTVEIVGSTIARNSVKSKGGGIYLYEVAATISDSTISGNRILPGAGGFGLRLGAAMHLESSLGKVVRSTVTANTGWSGGGAVTHSEHASLEIDHTIVAGNFSASPDIGSGVKARYSLIGYAQGIVDQGGNQVGTFDQPIDPKLSPLANHGGPEFLDGKSLETHVLLPGSPAIDAGDPAAVAGVNGVPEFDQRGLPWDRVANGDDVPEARIDMGAVEWQANPLPGDYNFNGVVDVADYSVWRDTVGSANDLRADGSSATTPGAPDGVVDEHDYDFWKSNYGNVLTLGQGAGSREQGEASVERASIMTAQESQPPALPGVASVFGSYLMRSSADDADAKLPPAEPGAQGRSGGANVHRDAALVAWVAQRAAGGLDSVDAGVLEDRDADAADECGNGSLDEAFAELKLALPAGGA